MENPTSVRIGACKITFNNVDLGWTKGGVKLDVKTTTKKEEVDNFTETTISEYITSRAVTISMDLAEPGASLLATIAFGTSNATLDGSGNTITGVAYGAGLMPSTNALQLILHPSDLAPDQLWDDLVVPKAAWDGNLSMSYTIDQERVFSIKFVAYPDSSGYLFYLGQ